ncbi:unnamed protein product [Meloidogyne enterolobii]|uniref:Uncharacterized protein n=1 Tax=Meloidogyne enterolobii TaxID=390850 RepID=A0ACB0ZAT0_MELEN
MHGVQFCKFIESHLRVQLVEQIEKKVDIIEYLHIRPLKLLDSEKCPKELEGKLKGYEDWLCTYWIVGIEIKQITLEKDKPVNFKELNLKIKTMKAKLAKTYENEVGQLGIPIQLDMNFGIRFMEKENLKKWCEENLEAGNKC